MDLYNNSILCQRKNHHLLVSSNLTSGSGKFVEKYLIVRTYTVYHNLFENSEEARPPIGLG
jgi:hypothetical protein